MATKGLEPNTRRMIVIVLGIIAVASIVAEVILKLDGAGSSEALITLAATSIGGIAGMAVPHTTAPEKIVVTPDEPHTFTGYGPPAPQPEVFYGGGGHPAAPWAVPGEDATDEPEWTRDVDGPS
jgi:hypothetical protein